MNAGATDFVVPDFDFLQKKRHSSYAVPFRLMCFGFLF